MENSILTSTKNTVIGQGAGTEFDDEIVMHINSAFATLCQLGVGGATGFTIANSAEIWDGEGGLDLPPMMLNMVRSYVFHKTKLLFDPPVTSYALTALKEQVREEEGRLQIYAEQAAADLLPPPVDEDEEEDL